MVTLANKDGVTDLAKQPGNNTSQCSNRGTISFAFDRDCYLPTPT